MKMLNNLRNIFLTICLVACAVIAKAQGGGGNEFTIPLSDPAKRGKIYAHLNSGSITIKGSARKDVLVKYSTESDEDRHHDKDDDDDDKNHNKNGNSSKNNRDGLKRIAGGGLELEASENSNMVKVSSGSWNVKTNLEIEVPSGMDVSAKTYNDGDLIITNIQGEVELKNYNGEITALNISGSVVATTYNGEIKVSFDKVTEGTPMSYFTYNGDVDISLPAATKASLKMKTEQGDIYTGFDMTIAPSKPESTKDPKSGTYRLKIDEWKKGDINGGGPELSLKTQNGDIYVRKK